MSEIELRCSALVFCNHAVLLVGRSGRDHWSLPGGVPGPTERLEVCARRELEEETGVRLTSGRQVLVLDGVDPAVARRIVDVVFLYPDAAGRLATSQAGLSPRLIGLDELDQVRLLPPVADQIAAVYKTRSVPPALAADPELRPWDMASDLDEASPEHP